MHTQDIFGDEGLCGWKEKQTLKLRKSHTMWKQNHVRLGWLLLVKNLAHFPILRRHLTWIIKPEEWIRYNLTQDLFSGAHKGLSLPSHPPSSAFFPHRFFSETMPPAVSCNSSPNPVFRARCVSSIRKKVLLCSFQVGPYTCHPPGVLSLLTPKEQLVL